MGSSATTELQRRTQGLCVRCSVPARRGSYCEFHRQQQNLYQRERKRRVNGAKRRYTGAESYTFTTGDTNGTTKD